MQDFKKLLVWNNAHALTLNIYEVSKKFPKEELYSLTNQLRRASVSVPANISEGCGKFSDADTCKFFQIALGSIHEVEYYLILCKDLLYIPLEEYERMNKTVNEIKAMLIT